MTKLFTIFFTILFLTGCGNPVNLGATLDQKIDTEIDNIQALQESDKQPNGKYKQRPLEIKDKVEYTVNEYETSKGEIGYTVLITKEENNKVYQKVIATGVDKKGLEYDWKLISETFINSTSTPK